MGHSGRSQRVRRRLAMVHEDAAGLDVGATFHVVAVPADRDAEPVRTFQSFTADLHALAEWLQAVGIRTIAMESTGVYWIPVYEILEQRGFEVLLVNARDTRNVPGRKTDVNDAQWLQQLHQHGLLRGSFRPRDALARLRAYLRHRERLLEYGASHIQHMQKALMQMNVQLHHVVTDITGVTGMQILRAIVAGNHDPAALAALRDRRCKASQATLTAALTGNYREEHLFALRQSLELYDFHRTQIDACDAQIEAALDQLNLDRPAPEQPLPSMRQQGGPNEPRFDVRSALYTLLGADLSQVHGFGPYTVLRLIAECGDDMTKWPTAKHLRRGSASLLGTRSRGAGCSARRPAGRPTGPARSCASPPSTWGAPTPPSGRSTAASPVVSEKPRR
jgi:transposase